MENKVAFLILQWLNVMKI